ncbi:hypothetical protein ACN47E_007577 [Coniothyrium glycines]
MPQPSPHVPEEQSESRITTTTTATVDSPEMSKTPSLTLILAATPSLGIGKNGTLPWPQLKKEMGFFARVTKRTSPASESATTRKINAVIMGSKTWTSIPPKFRPLKDRLNVIITRDPKSFQDKLKDEPKSVEGPLICSGILDALSKLQDTAAIGDGAEIDRVFVIGGASIYQTALELPQTSRVLLTKIHKEYDCDTFFSVNLDETTFWKEKSREEVQAFTGEEISEIGIEEQGVRFEFCMYEKAE